VGFYKFITTEHLRTSAVKAAIFDILINFEIYKSRIPLQSAAEHPNAATLPKRMLRQAAT
jgi:hypothetical protein